MELGVLGPKIGECVEIAEVEDLTIINQELIDLLQVFKSPQSLFNCPLF